MEDVIVNLNYELLFFGIILPILLGYLLGNYLIRLDNNKKTIKIRRKIIKKEPKL